MQKKQNKNQQKRITGKLTSSLALIGVIGLAISQGTQLVVNPFVKILNAANSSSAVDTKFSVGSVEITRIIDEDAIPSQGDDSKPTTKTVKPNQATNNAFQSGKSEINLAEYKPIKNGSITVSDGREYILLSKNKKEYLILPNNLTLNDGYIQINKTGMTFKVIAIGTMKDFTFTIKADKEFYSLNLNDPAQNTIKTKTTKDLKLSLQ
jgi:hypothetical protein